jgi:hypothetical protein
MIGNDFANTRVARQHIRNMQQWSNWEAVFPSRSVRQLHGEITELLGGVFSIRSVPRLCNEKQLRLRESLETTVRRVRGWCEMPPAWELV